MLEALERARRARCCSRPPLLIIFLLGFLVCADVIGRAIFNTPVKGTPEIVSMSIVIICFLLAGYSVQSGSMIYDRRVRPACSACAASPSLDLLSAMLGTAVLRPDRVGQLRAGAARLEQRRISRAKARCACRSGRRAIVVMLGSALVVVSYVAARRCNAIRAAAHRTARRRPTPRRRWPEDARCSAIST